MNLPTHADKRLHQAEDLLKSIQAQITGFYEREISITDDPFAIADMLAEFHTRIREHFETHPGKADSLIQKL